MIQKISEPVDVILSSVGARRGSPAHIKPLALKWSNREYPVLQVGLRHTYRDGATRHHVFSVVAQTCNTESPAKLDRAKWDSRDNCLFFRLNLNADTLHWTLEEVSDGLPD